MTDLHDDLNDDERWLRTRLEAIHTPATLSRRYQAILERGRSLSPRRWSVARSLAGAAVLAVLIGAAGAAVGIRLRGHSPAPALSAVAGPVGTPSARVDAAMAYDPANGTTVLFGGSGSAGVTGDTWVWDGEHWHEQATAAEPAPRAGASMAYDPQSRRLILFGGVALSPLPPGSCPPPMLPLDRPYLNCQELHLTDTWAWDGGRWLAEKPQHHPLNPVSATVMVTDQVRGAVVLLEYGRSSPPTSPPAAVQLYEWRGGDWTALDSTGPSPVLEQWSSLAFDRSSGNLIFFAAQGTCSPADFCAAPVPITNGRQQTSALKDSSWSSKADGPALVMRGRLVEDGGRTILLLGETTTSDQPSMWSWSQDRWAPVSAAAMPPAGPTAALAYDSARDRVIAFGGTAPLKPLHCLTEACSPHPINETWEWDGSHWELVSPGVQPTPLPTPTPAPTAELTPPPFPSVDWSSQNYPVNCGGKSTGSVAAYANPEPGANLAVVLATCRAGAGSPPVTVLVYDDSGPGGSPHLRQTLLSGEDNWLPAPNGTTVSGMDLSITVYGYSSEAVPRCCPDLHTTLTWKWSGQKYVATKTEPPHLNYQFPSPSA